jgi:hypothetical protein
VPLPAYSRQLFAGSVSTTVFTDATVPAGFVWVVRSIDVSNNQPGVASFLVVVVGLAILWISPQVPSDASAHWDGHQVLNAGQRVQSYTLTGQGSIMASGYQLSIAGS